MSRLATVSPKPAERGSWGGKKDVVYINAIIDALVENSLVNVLAEPNLTAKSGEAATFMSGGEFPFPVGNGDNGPRSNSRSSASRWS